MWFIIALICSLFIATQGALSKILLQRTDTFIVVWALFACALPFFIILLPFHEIPTLGEQFPLAIGCGLVINLIGFTFYVLGFRYSPLSLAVPFLAFTPAFMIITSRIILNERVGILGSIGILCIVFGAYIMNGKSLRHGLLAPIKAILRERGCLCMLITSLLWGIAANFDKMATMNSSPFFYLLIFHIGFTIFYLPVVLPRFRQHWPEIKKNWVLFFLLGITGVAGLYAQMTAIQWTVTAYVVAIKRAGMVFSIFYGWFIFREKQIGLRLVASGFMVGGVMLIAFA